MTIILSVPSGYHARELLLPLKEHLERDPAVTQVIVITPAAPYRADVFPDYGAKFSFGVNPPDDEGHRRLMHEAAPAIVVTPTVGLDDADTPILRAAQQAGIPTLTFVASWDNVYKMERFKRFNKPYVLADHFAVWNTMNAAHLREIFPEIESERITVVGAPRLDFFAHHDRIPGKSALLQYLNIPDDGGKLIHLATTELYPMEYLVRALHRAAHDGRIPNKLHLYASVHPGGDMKKHEAYAQKYGVTVRFSFGRRAQAPLPSFLYNPTLEETYMLVALFKHTAVLVNHSSTVAIESFLADVPVINVKYGARFDWWRWRRSMVYRDFNEHYRDITDGGATSVVQNERELVAALKADLADPTRKRAERAHTLAKMITRTDGTAGRALLDKIKELAH